METELSGKVLGASARQTTNGKTVYDVALSDGNTYVTFMGALFTKAQQLQGQNVSARVKVEQKGQYTNFYLNDIAPQGQLAPSSGAVATANPQIVRPQGGMTPEREQKIVKQSSFSTAFNFVASLFQGAGESELETAKELAHSLARELYGHVMGEQPMPEPVAAGVAGAPPENTGDAIPWL